LQKQLAATEQRNFSLLLMHFAFNKRNIGFISFEIPKS